MAWTPPKKPGRLPGKVLKKAAKSTQVRGANPSDKAGFRFEPVKKSVLQQRRVKVQHARTFMQPHTAPGNSQPLAEGRMIFVMFMLTLLFGGMMTKLVMVAMLPPLEPRQSIRDMPVEPGRRGNIYDRNGVLMAATLQVKSLYADPQRILDVTEAVAKIRTVLPELSATTLTRVLRDDKRRFVWLKRRLTPRQAQELNSLGIPGLAFHSEYVRLYPHRNLASHVLGAVNVDNAGLAGVELAQDKTLRKGDDVTLAVDIRAQEMLRTTVLRAMEKSGSKAGWGVLMDVPTGELVAMTSLPDFDPNHYGTASADSRFNRVAQGAYEMGSTFKLFTIAQGLADGHITPQTQVDCREPIQIGRFTIRDYHAKKSILTATEILRYSSNIGAAKIADMGGPEGQKAFLQKMGMLEPVNVGVAESAGVRYPSNWGRVQTFTISYGHGMAVTPLHMVAAVGALTDGTYRMPSVLKGGSNVPPREVLAPAVIPQIRDLMRDVVVSGSGRNSSVPGYDIGGKTGTAEKISGRGYDEARNLVSFIAAVPLEAPKYVVLIMLDEPKQGYHTGGLSAAPAVGEFLKQYAVWSGLVPDAKVLSDWQRKQKLPLWQQKVLAIDTPLPEDTLPPAETGKQKKEDVTIDWDQ